MDCVFPCVMAMVRLGTADCGDRKADVTRYYFHIRNATCVVPDEEGAEMPNIFAAQAEAYFSACDLAWAAIRGRTGRDANSVEIADEAGNILGWVAVPGTLH